MPQKIFFVQMEFENKAKAKASLYLGNYPLRSSRIDTKHFICSAQQDCKTCPFNPENLNLESRTLKNSFIPIQALKGCFIPKIAKKNLTLLRFLSNNYKDPSTTFFPVCLM